MIEIKDEYGLFIGNQEVPAASGKTFESTNPATGEVLSRVAEAGPEDVDRAARAAEKAFEEGSWRKTHPYERAKLLRRFAELIEKNRDRLAELDTLDCGKPIGDTRNGDIPISVMILDWYAGLADKIEGRIADLGADRMGLILREPYGPVGQITAWNFPTANVIIKIAPALAAGNTVVMKPAEQTPLSALELAKLAAEAGLPEGVFNVVTGFGETGEALVRNPIIQKVSFTGSTEVGGKVMVAAAAGLKPVTLELGGKTPFLVFPDADFEAAVDGAMFGCFVNQGQVCVASTRLVVHKDVHDKFVEKLVGTAKDVPVGDPMDEKNKLGSIVSKEQFEKVDRYVRVGQEEGATLACGGGRLGGPDHGFFYQPTVFTDVKPDMRIAQEEIFGPVLSVQRVDSIEDAVAIGNNTEYGLAAAVWSRDIVTIMKVARGLKAGNIWVNCAMPLDPSMPHGGYKKSGFGRENGWCALESYMRWKSVHLNLDIQPTGWALG